MLVGVREYRREEVQRICGLSEEALVSHYSLLRNGNEVIMADVTDTRARKVMNFDYYAVTAGGLFAESVGPIVRAVLPPVSSPQVVVVVDGTEMTRFHTLLDLEEGLIVQVWRLMMETPEFKHLVEAVHIAIVELDDNNCLRDLAARMAPSREPVIIEDTDDHFTSVEDASYVELQSERDILALLKHARRKVLPELHQVFSFILSYKEATDLPNSTIQFVSLAVSEVTRGMRSTRHCVTTAASLIESRSPSITFAGTKILSLLKPVLLSQQPGLWISCFAPTSPSVGNQRETFKDSFSIAYTMSRVYGSRVAVGVSDAFQLLVDPKHRLFFNESYEYIEIQPRTDVPKPSAPNMSEITKRGVKKKAMPSSSPLSLLSSLLITKRGEGKEESIYRDGAFAVNAIGNTNTTSTSSPLVAPRNAPTGLLVTPSDQRTKPLNGRKTPLRFCTGNGSSSQSTSGRPVNNRCSSMEKHPYHCSARYELETYRRVMESAMDHLRRDIRHYATQLEDARRQVWNAKHGKNCEGEVEQLRASLLESERQRELLSEDHTKREKELQAKVAELQTLCNRLLQESRDQVASSVSEQKEVRGESVGTQTSDPFLLSLQTQKPDEEDGFVVSKVLQKETKSESKDMQHSSEWLEVVSYHQRELEDYAERERSYRKHIILLEEALNKSESETAQARAEMARREHELSLELVNKEHKEKELEMAKNFSEGLEKLRTEAFEAQKANMMAEKRLEACLGELQQERRQREALEAELRRLQASCAQQTDDGAAKEIVQLLKESYDRQYSHLEREVEELRQRTQLAASREGTPPRSGSSVSTPMHKKGGRKSTGMISPAAETQSSEIAFSGNTPQTECFAVKESPSTRIPLVHVKAETTRFEDFMKEEPTYTFHLPKALERIRS